MKTNQHTTQQSESLTYRFKNDHEFECERIECHQKNFHLKYKTNRNEKKVDLNKPENKTKIIQIF